MAVRRGEGGVDPDLASLAPRTPSDTDYAEIRPIHLAAKGFRRTVLTFGSYRPEEIVAIARHIAGNEKIAIAEAVTAAGRDARGCVRCQPIPVRPCSWRSHRKGGGLGMMTATTG